MLACPLCQKNTVEFFHQDRKRAYFHCFTCQLVFSDVNSYLPPYSQKKRYNKNTPSKKQQQSFELIQLILQQLQSLTNEKLIGLNYGGILNKSDVESIENKGHKLLQYDPFLIPDRQVLHNNYDFICCYQIFEHFKNPKREWLLLQKMLKPGALLAIKTHLLKRLDLFEKWHHKNNLEHVNFYQKETFEYLAKKSGFSLLFATNNAILMQKPTGSDIKPSRIKLICTR